MDGWDLALLALVGYVAIAALVRLMVAQRDALVARLRSQFNVQHKAIRSEAPAPQAEPQPQRKAA